MLSRSNGSALAVGAILDAPDAAADPMTVVAVGWLAAYLSNAPASTGRVTPVM